MSVKNDGTMKIKCSEKAVWRVIDGDVVVLLPEEGMLHALGGCGSRIWELIEKGISIQEIVDNICDEYDVESDRVRKDVTEFIDSLQAMKLVEITPTIIGEVDR